MSGRSIDPAGRVALITGGGTGIGRAIALRLARAGASVAVLGRRPEPLERVVTAMGSVDADALAVPCDITDDAQVRSAIGLVQATLGPIDILINNAGVAPSAPLAKTDDDLWDATLRVNVRAPLVLVRALEAGFRARGYGRIVNVASTAALRGYRFTSAYTASKHALAGLTRSLSAELLSSGITVNAVCPGFVETMIVEDAARKISAKTERSEEDAVAMLAAQNPIGRLISPDEVAAAVLSFCGPDSGALSGHCLVLDGGTQPV